MSDIDPILPERGPKQLLPPGVIVGPERMAPGCRLTLVLHR